MPSSCAVHSPLVDGGGDRASDHLHGPGADGTGVAEVVDGHRTPGTSDVEAGVDGGAAAAAER